MLFRSDGGHFFQGRLPKQSAATCRAAQGGHAVADRLFANGLLIDFPLGFKNQTANRIGKSQHLMNAGSPGITVAAFVASDIFIKGRLSQFLFAKAERQRYGRIQIRQRLFAMGTEQTHQPLGHHQIDGIGDQKRLDAHLVQTGYHTGRIWRRGFHPP